MLHGYSPSDVLSGLCGGNQNTATVRQERNTQGRVRMYVEKTIFLSSISSYTITVTCTGSLLGSYMVLAEVFTMVQALASLKSSPQLLRSKPPANRVVPNQSSM